MTHTFPLSFIQAAKDYVDERGMDMNTAVIIAGSNSNLNVFSAKQGVIRWTTPGMRDLDKDGGVFVNEKQAKEVLAASLKRFAQDAKIYPDAQIHLVKDLKNK